MAKSKILRSFEFEGEKRINITLIRPYGYLYSEAFREPIEAIARDAWSKNLDYTISENKLDDKALNIILGAHLTCRDGQPEVEIPDNSIIINLERLSCIRSAWGDQISAKYMELMKSKKVVDYCESNNSVLRSEVNKEASFLYRPWHDERWCKIPKPIEKEFDLCIIGSKTERRQKAVHELRRRGLSVSANNNLFSSERDNILAKSKIILNIHAYEDADDIELWRINYLSSNGLYILSERSCFEEGEEEISNALHQCSIDKIAETAENLIKHYSYEEAINKGEELRKTALTIQDSTKTENTTDKEKNRALEKIYLNLSCGQTYYTDSLNIDKSSNSRADLILDIEAPWDQIQGIQHLKDKREVLLHESQFDAIDANQTLHNSNKLGQVISNISKLLKPGGLLYIHGPYQNSSDAWADPFTKRELNENIIHYLNEWSKYSNLFDSKLIPKYINIRTKEDEDGKILPEKETTKSIEICLAKRIEARGPEGNQYRNFHKKELGTLRLSEKSHRRLLINTSRKQIDETNDNKKPTVSLLTPTMGKRFTTLPLLWEWILRQDYPHDKFEWIIVTDNSDERKFLKKKLEKGSSRGIEIKIKNTPHKLPIGAKRNFCNHLADGEILINMDDDDYYFPERVSHSVENLKNSEFCGSQQLPIYFLDDKSMWISDPGKGISCAGSFAYRRSILEKTWYSADAVNGEEISFSDFYTLPTTPLDPFKTMICISHAGNTFDKRTLRANFEGESFKLRSGENLQGKESFFKIERNAREDNRDTADWKLWYQACLMNEIGHESKSAEMPELFSHKSTTSLERLTEAILGMVKSQE